MITETCHKLPTFFNYCIRKHTYSFKSIFEQCSLFQNFMMCFVCTVCPCLYCYTSSLLLHTVYTKRAGKLETMAVLYSINSFQAIFKTLAKKKKIFCHECNNNGTLLKFVPWTLVEFYFSRGLERPSTGTCTILQKKSEQVSLSAYCFS